MKKNIASIEQEFFRIYKAAQAYSDPEAWLAAKQKIESVEQSSALTNAIEHIALAATGIGPSLEAIKSAGITPDAISKALSIGGGIGAVTASGVDMHKIRKFSSLYNNSNQYERDRLLKRANIISDIGGAISGVMPYFSIIFKGISALYNLYQAFSSYKELAAEGEKIGLKWYETLFPDSLGKLLEDPGVTSDPEKMGIIGCLCKVASNFIEQGLATILQGISASVETYTMITRSLSESSNAPGFLSSFIRNIIPGLTAVLQIGYERLSPKKHMEILQKVMSIIESHINGGIPRTTPPPDETSDGGMMSALTSGLSSLLGR